MKLNSFNYLIKQGFSGAWKNRIMSFASFCIMTVSMLMVGMSVLITLNINGIIGGIEDRNQIIVQVADTASEAEIADLEATLKRTNNISEVVFFSRNDAWEGMKSGMSEDKQDLFQYADTNPLPDTFKIRVDRIEEMSQTTIALEALNNVESVRSPTDFTDILISLKKVVTVISIAIIIALFIVCMVIISNTTRSSVFARRKEINIMKYVGATNNFIKIPFLVEGMAIGLLSAAVALLITKFAYASLFDVLTSTTSLMSVFGFSNLIPFESMTLHIGLSYLIAGIFIGSFGTVVSTQKYLKV